ncbi:MAG: LD-carboxypeptidase [Desulfobulbaceae bacterium]|nr:LD-carboxypeptidase [Desulfobulbaceae bacterium]
MHLELRLPPPLKRGDTIGIFCPAGPPKNLELLQNGMEMLAEAGFQTHCEGSMAIGEGEYLAAPDTARATALHRLWADEHIRAVMAVRGGYGCLRLAPLLDMALLQRHSKWLIGFSDLTLLLNHLQQQAALVTLHGPMATSLSRCRREDIHQLFSLLTGTFEDKLRIPGLEIIRGGSGQGRLVGGNLATLVHCLATPWDSSWDGCILMLEDTGEYLYRLDRMLTQLQQAGRFDRLAGLLLGDFDTGTGSSAADLRLQEQVWQRVLELLPPGFPIWANVPFGHRGRNMPLPLGMPALMDSNSGTLTLLTNSVIRS